MHSETGKPSSGSRLTTRSSRASRLLHSALWKRTAQPDFSRLAGEHAAGAGASQNMLMRRSRARRRDTGRRLHRSRCRRRMGGWPESRCWVFKPPGFEPRWDFSRRFSSCPRPVVTSGNRWRRSHACTQAHDGIGARRRLSDVKRPHAGPNHGPGRRRNGGSPNHSLPGTRPATAAAAGPVSPCGSPLRRNSSNTDCPFGCSGPMFRAMSPSAATDENHCGAWVYWDGPGWS